MPDLKEAITQKIIEIIFPREIPQYDYIFKINLIYNMLLK